MSAYLLLALKRLKLGLQFTPAVACKAEVKFTEREKHSHCRRLPRYLYNRNSEPKSHVIWLVELLYTIVDKIGKILAERYGR